MKWFNADGAVAEELLGEGSNLRSSSEKLQRRITVHGGEIFLLKEDSVTVVIPTANNDKKQDIEQKGGLREGVC